MRTKCVSLHVYHTCTKFQQLRGNNIKASSKSGRSLKRVTAVARALFNNKYLVCITINALISTLF